MYIKPQCQNRACLYHKNPDPSMIIKKGKDKRKHGKPVQRYQCKACGEQFTSSALTENTFHKPELLREIFLRYTSGYSVKRISEELEIHRETTTKAIKYLGEKCKTYHYELMRTGFLNTDKIFFDEMETYIHSKVYPVSLGLVVDVQYKRIIDIRIAEIRLKGALKKKVLKDNEGTLPFKIARRQNKVPTMLLELMKIIKMTLRPPSGVLFSDKKRTYKILVNRYLPSWVKYVPELSLTEFKDHSDPQALGRFNNVCAQLRTYVSSMARKSLITVKTEEALTHHLYMFITRYNKYDLQEVLKFGLVQEDFYEREWRKRKEAKVIRLFNQNRKDLVVVIALILWWRSKSNSAAQNVA